MEYLSLYSQGHFKNTYLLKIGQNLRLRQHYHLKVLFLCGSEVMDQFSKLTRTRIYELTDPKQRRLEQK